MTLERLLIFQVNQLGDMVVSLPCLRGLRRMLPQARITLVTSPYGDELIRNSDLVDEVISMPFNDYRNLWRSPIEILSLVQKLRRQKFDASLSANDECSTTAILARMAGVPVRIGFFSRAKAAPLYTLRLNFNYAKNIAENRYDLLHALKSAFSINTEVPSLERVAIAFTPEEETQFESRLRPLLGPSFMAVHPFSKLAFRTWRPERFASFIIEFQRRHPTRKCIILTDGRSFPHTADADHVVTLNQTSIRELAWVLREADVFVGNNSGPFHLACAMGTPSICLTGPTQRHWWPMQFPDVKTVNLWAGLACSPCENPGRTVRCHRNLEFSECLERITVEQVMDAAETLLTTPNKSRNNKPEGLKC